MNYSMHGCVYMRPYCTLYLDQGLLHPIVARIIWSDDCQSLSPYRFCKYIDTTNYQSCGYSCDESLSLSKRLYVLDFAGGGAVHLLGKHELYCCLNFVNEAFFCLSPCVQIKRTLHKILLFSRWNGCFDGLPVCQISGVAGQQRATCSTGEQFVNHLVLCCI